MNDRRAVRNVFVLAAMAVLVCVGITAAELPTATPESVGMSAARLARLDEALRAEIAAGKLPGIVVAIAR